MKKYECTQRVCSYVSCVVEAENEQKAREEAIVVFSDENDFDAAVLENLQDDGALEIGEIG